MKKVISLVMAAAMLFVLCACAQKTVVKLTDLKLGVSKEIVAETIGAEYKMAGTTPDRMIFENVALFDFIGNNEKTKLTVNLNTEDKAFAYSYYMYENLDSNYSKVKSYMEGLYGPAAEGDNASETWTDGDRVYYLFKQSDYIAIGFN